MTSYVLVPVEATEEMFDAANAAVRREFAELGLGDGSHLDASKAAGNYYRAMLAARPAVPEEVVERVAEALYEADRPPHDPSWSRIHPSMQRGFHKLARAAIRALGGEVAA